MDLEVYEGDLKEEFKFFEKILKDLFINKFQDLEKELESAGKTRPGVFFNQKKRGELLYQIVMDSIVVWQPHNPDESDQLAEEDAATSIEKFLQQRKISEMDLVVYSNLKKEFSIVEMALNELFLQHFDYFEKELEVAGDDQKRKGELMYEKVMKSVKCQSEAFFILTDFSSTPRSTASTSFSLPRTPSSRTKKSKFTEAKEKDHLMPANQECSTSFSLPRAPSSRTKKRKFTEAKEKEPLMPADQEMSLKDQGQDAFDIFGQNIAAKLRKLSEVNNEQGIIAEKLMSDVIFHGQLQGLTLDTSIHIPPPQRLSSSTAYQL